MVYSTLQELFADESRWYKHYFATNADGKHCSPLDPTATRFCLVGGYQRVYDENQWDKILFKLKKELKLTNKQTLAGWNDDPNRRFSDIVDLVKKAGV